MVEFGAKMADASQNRLFLSQERLDLWIEADRADFEGDVLILIPSGYRLRMKPGVYVGEEATGEADAHGLVGKAKDMEQLDALGAEHVSGSILLGDNAYNVVDGFLCRPLFDPAE